MKCGIVDGSSTYVAVSLVQTQIVPFRRQLDFPVPINNREQNGHFMNHRRMHKMNFNFCIAIKVILALSLLEMNGTHPLKRSRVSHPYKYSSPDKVQTDQRSIDHHIIPSIMSNTMYLNFCTPFLSSLPFFD
jgi:hypothetical protein